MLELFVVHERPRDFPHSYVLRRQVVHPDGSIAVDPLPLAVQLASDPRALVLLRAAIPRGCTQVQGPGDDPDPCIVEAWLA